jgi:hypothetical protein
VIAASKKISPRESSEGLKEHERHMIEQHGQQATNIIHAKMNINQQRCVRVEKTRMSIAQVADRRKSAREQLKQQMPFMPAKIRYLCTPDKSNFTKTTLRGAAAKIGGPSVSVSRLSVAVTEDAGQPR